MFYIYDQNNSGGFWSEPALHVIIEADSPEEADHNALFAGVYFDDTYSIDCGCCGTRWTRQSDWSETCTDIDEAIKKADRGSIVGNDGLPNYYVLRKLEEV